MFATLLISVVYCAGSPPLEIESADDRARVTITARLTKEQLGRMPVGPVDQAVAKTVLKLCLVEDNGKLGPAIFGRYIRRGETLVLTPRYRLAGGQLYRVVLAVTASKNTSRDYRVPPRVVKSKARVEHIYPSGDVLPANHLKFYIHFSKPMREGRAIFDLIRLLDKDGREIRDAWRRTELWTADAKRLTLWIHPGRVKQGVNLREDLGPVLKPGQEYSLVLDAKLQDADGAPLGIRFVKKFRTVQSDYHRPLPQNWQMEIPTAGTREPLRLEFREPMDHAMLRRFLEIRDQQAELVQGKITMTKSESIWEFKPRLPWKTTRYHLVVDGLLEDLAGNTPLRVFDTDLRLPRGPLPVLKLAFQPIKG